MRRCARCKEWQSIANFGPQGKYYASYCRPCSRVKYREYNKNRPEPRNRSAYILEWKRLNYFGVTRYQLRELLDDQDGVCAICGRVLDWRKMHVDHDHIVNQVRGLLCYKCNIGLGHFDDDSDLILGALKYLRRFEGTLNL